MATTLEGLLATLRSQGVFDERVLDAMRKVDRKLFVRPEHEDVAYENVALPIGHGQTISQPLVVALMTQALRPEPESRVLEIGTGSGYQAAILSELAREVVSVERVTQLAQSAERLLARLGRDNVHVRAGSGSAGWPQEGPYDRILVTAGAPRIPVGLLGDLAKGGRLVVPVGPHEGQRLLVLTKDDQGIHEEDLGPVGFVPLIGRGAWNE